MKYRAIVIGASAGGFDAINDVVSQIRNLIIPIIIVQHISSESENYLPRFLNENLLLTVKEAENWEPIKPGIVYFAPPDYHLMIEKNGVLTFSADTKVNYSRPSVDVLFATAADAYGRNLIGVILTVANQDGSNGLKTIKASGGLAIVQDPKTAEYSKMPLAAIKKVKVDHILSTKRIGKLLNELQMENHSE